MFLSKWVAGLLLTVVLLDRCILSVVRNVFVLFDCWGFAWHGDSLVDYRNWRCLGLCVRLESELCPIPLGPDVLVDSQQI